MNLTEHKQFFQEVAFVHFPALFNWMKTASIDPEKTLEAWQRTLHDVTFEEALSVADRWTRDELPRPQAFELPDWALHLRAVVMQDRANRKRQIIDGINRDREPDSSEYSHVSLRPYIARVFESAEAFKRGEISIEDHRENTKQILSDHEQAYKRNRS